MSFSLTPISIVPRNPVNRNDCLVYMSSQLFTHLQVKKDLELNITLGKKTITTKIQIEDMAPDEIVLPENIIKDFCLPIQRYKFLAVYRPNCHTLQLGPVIGLLTDFHLRESEQPHFRSVHTFCEELHHVIAENGGFFYVFSFSEFPSKGYHFENGKWVPSELPLPDVVHNRIHSRRIEQHPEYKNFRQRLEQWNIPIFNDRFLSKWEVYEDLKKENQLYSFVPETKIFSKEHLNAFAQKYDTVFIKPIHGSQGRNIFKLIRIEENLYTYQTSSLSQSERKNNTYSLVEIYHQIKPLLHNQIYIIQQGISFMMYESCAMDFRVLCHQNINNLWEVTSIVARVGAEQEFVSNIARGGRIMRPFNALLTCMNKNNALKVLTLMKELAIETASIINRNSPGITGELGIDIGVDQEGELWLIEVNSKPSKNFGEGLSKIRPSATAIIQFCTKLGFNAETDKEDT